MAGDGQKDAGAIRRPVKVLNPAVDRGTRTSSAAHEVEEVELKITLPGSIGNERYVEAVRGVFGQAVAVRAEREDASITGHQIDVADSARRLAVERVHERAGKCCVLAVRGGVNFRDIADLACPWPVEMGVELLGLLVEIGVSEVSARAHLMCHGFDPFRDCRHGIICRHCVDKVAMSVQESPIVVVGAGIIGVAIAFELRRRGERVILVERDVPGMGASYGNMASIAVTEFMPVSRPAVWAQMPKWLLDPEGPVRVRPSYLPRLIPWFIRFLAAGRPRRLRELEAAGATLCHRAHEDLDALLRAADLTNMLSAEGCLSLYADDEELEADRYHLNTLRRFGFRFEILTGGAIREREPALAKWVTRAALFPDNRSIADPFRLVTALVEKFRGLGGELQRGEVVGFEDRNGAVASLQLSGGRRIAAAKTVLAAGAHTGCLSRLIGEPIPLETERGYHTQLSSAGISIRHSLIWPARAFMVTPTAGGIRVGGTVEMAGLAAPPDYRRAKVLVKHAREALPAIKAGDQTEWMGHRPALPDTIPVISASAKRRGLFYATGHGHLGLTYAATTSRLVADLVTGVQPPVDLAPYRVGRF